MSSDWIIWLAWLGVIAACIWLIHMARKSLFGDRSRGRRRCPRCWYDMSHSPTLTCGECGHTAQQEADLFRTRRNIGRALACIALCVTIILAVQWNAAQRGWTGMMPSRMIILLLPLDSNNGSLVREISTRASAGTLSASDMKALIDRCASGDWTAEPTSDRWIAKYGRLIDAWQRTIAAQPELEQLVLAIPPRVNLIGRQAWPADVQPSAGLQVREWWPFGYELRVRYRVVDQPALSQSNVAAHGREAANDESGSGDSRSSGGRDSGGWVSYRKRINDRFAPTLPIAFDVPIEGETQVAVDVEVYRRPAPPRAALDLEEGDAAAGNDADSAASAAYDPFEQGQPWERVMATRLALPLRIDQAMTKTLRTVDSPQMTAAILDTFDAGVVKWDNGPSPVRTYFAPDATFQTVFDDVAVGVRVELWRGNDLARRLDMWWIGGSKAGADRGMGWEATLENLDLLRRLGTDTAGWEMRISSDPSLALRAGDAPAYWTGSLTMPLKVERRDGGAPRRAWTRETVEDQ